MSSSTQPASASPCLVISFNGPKPKNGRRVYDSFLEANRACFWNRDLLAAMNSMVYMGFMRPGTLFVSAPANHLQTVRCAWARRVLKPAVGYQIAALGDLGAIHTVQQTHFVPLGDVLCDAIAYLNRNGCPATLARVRDHIAKTCVHVAAPTLEMLRQTVHSLTATGLVYQMGEHFFVSVPAQTKHAENRSIECQTGESIIVEEKPMKPFVEKIEKKRTGGSIFSRLFRKNNNNNEAKENTAAKAVPTFVAPPAPASFEWGPCSTRVDPSTVAPKPPASLPPPVPVQEPTTARFNAYIDRDFEKHYVNGTSADVAVSTLDRRRRHRRAERRHRTLSSSQSSSECLNYGPIDPPECLPRDAELIDDICRRRHRNVKRRESYHMRSSTPVVHSDSAYSPSPATTESEDPIPEVTGWSDTEDHPNLGDQCGRIEHTYVNLHRRFQEQANIDEKEEGHNDSTQFEEFTMTTVCLPPSPPPPPRRYINLISNL